MAEEAPKKDQDKKPKSNFLAEAGSFFRGLAGSIEDSHNEVKGLDEAKRRSVTTLFQKKSSGPPYRHIDDFVWAKYVITWSNYEVVILGLLTALIWLTVYLAFERPIYNIQADANIDTKLRQYTNIPQLDQDLAVTWLIQTLQLLHQTDQTKKPFLSKLEGQVDPRIIKRFQDEYDRSEEKIAEYNMVKNLNITQIVSMYINEEEERMTVYALGYVLRTTTWDPKKEDAPSPRIQVLYFSESVIQKVIPSKLNPYGFYLERLTEKIGDDAREWMRSLNLQPGVTKAPVTPESN